MSITQNLWIASHPLRWSIRKELDIAGEAVDTAIEREERYMAHLRYLAAWEAFQIINETLENAWKKTLS